MRVVAPFLALCVLLAPPVRASTFVALDTDALVRASEVVAVVDVLRLRAAARGGHIETVAELGVSQALRGALGGDTLVAKFPGGIVGDWVQQVEGAPALAEGGTYVVFLRRDAAGTLRFTGLSQGALKVDRDAAGTWIVRRTIGARIVVPLNGRLVPGTPPPETEPLDTYLAGLARALRSAP